MEAHDIELIKNLIREVLNGTLSREGLYSQWAEAWEENEFIIKLFDNLESSVEHLPSKVFSSKIDMEKWKASEEYKYLNIDLELLEKYPTLSIGQLLYRRYQMERDRT